MPASRAIRVADPPPDASRGHDADLPVPPDHGPHHRPGAPRRRQVDLQGDGGSARGRGEGERFRRRRRVRSPAVDGPPHREHDRSLARAEREGAPPASPRPSRIASGRLANGDAPARAARKRSTPSSVSPHVPPGARHAAGLEDRRALEPDLREHAPRWGPGERDLVGVHRVAREEPGVLLREAEPREREQRSLGERSAPTCSASSRS